MDAAEPTIVTLAKTLIGLVAGAIAKAVIQAALKETKAWMAKDKELEAMSERLQEPQPTVDPFAGEAPSAAMQAEIDRLSAELNRERERAAQAEYSAAVSADEAQGLGEDLRRVAGEKALAEHERDEEHRKRIDAEAKAAEALAEAEEWRLAAVAAEHRQAAEAAKKNEDRLSSRKETPRAEVPPRRPDVPGNAPGAGNGPGNRSPGPSGPSTVRPRQSKGHRDQ